MANGTLKYRNHTDRKYYYLCPEKPKVIKKKRGVLSKELEVFKGNWWDDICVYEIVMPTFEPLQEIKPSHYELEMEKFDKAKELFLSNLPELLEKHKGKYACAIQGNILIGENKDKLREEAIEKYGYHSMYVAKIGEDKKKKYHYKPFLKIAVK